MDFKTTYLSRKELRRFLEVAAGGTTAKNTPEEDALFRKKLVEERMFAFINLDTGTTTADYRAVVLSDLGKEYFAHYMNEKKRAQKENRRYWFGVFLSVVGIAVAIASVVVTVWLSIGDIC